MTAVVRQKHHNIGLEYFAAFHVRRLVAQSRPKWAGLVTESYDPVPSHRVKFEISQWTSNTVSNSGSPGVTTKQLAV